ncbi:hypothetical protein BDN72DRAFT_905474 [Pluteus cervinus]|uniref:Uncharacterized protein n=1 Tax=Pluteus cervinus TaxID=181527 RepID=A0ACD3A2B2_9AGAR|nr:hypothetical protein BDN72DRAFT_905474 [Pluteus cervinus]
MNASSVALPFHSTHSNAHYVAHPSTNTPAVAPPHTSAMLVDTKPSPPVPSPNGSAMSVDPSPFSSYIRNEPSVLMSDVPSPPRSRSSSITPRPTTAKLPPSSPPVQDGSDTPRKRIRASDENGQMRIIEAPSSTRSQPLDSRAAVSRSSLHSTSTLHAKDSPFYTPPLHFTNSPPVGPSPSGTPTTHHPYRHLQGPQANSLWSYSQVYYPQGPQANPLLSYPQVYTTTRNQQPVAGPSHQPPVRDPTPFSSISRSSTKTLSQTPSFASSTGLNDDQRSNAYGKGKTPERDTEKHDAYGKGKMPERDTEMHDDAVNSAKDRSGEISHHILMNILAGLNEMRAELKAFNIELQNTREVLPQLVAAEDACCDHFRTLLRIENTSRDQLRQLPVALTDDELWDLEGEYDAHGNCWNINNFRVDFMKPWSCCPNASAKRVFIKSFLNAVKMGTYIVSETLLKEPYVEGSFYGYFNHLKPLVKNAQSGGTFDNIVRKRRAQNSRRKTMWKIVSANWRSDGFTGLLRNLDKIYFENWRRPSATRIRTQYRSTTQKTPGNIPRTCNSSTLSADGVAPVGLPITCYSQAWYNALPDWARRDLGAKMVNYQFTIDPRELVRL